MVSTGTGILITLEIFGGAGRSLLRVVEARELTTMQVLSDDALEATEAEQVIFHALQLDALVAEEGDDRAQPGQLLRCRVNRP